MGKTLEGLATINSFMRTLMGVVVMGAVGAGGWVGYTNYYRNEFAVQEKERDLQAARHQLETTQQQLDEKIADVQAKAKEIAALQVDVQEKAAHIQRLDTAMRLLKVDHRVARMTCVKQTGTVNENNLVSVLEFVELDEQGNQIEAPRLFQIKGDVVYLDNWVVKFDDKYIEDSDLDRGTSLVLFRRIFGEQQQPLEGYPIDSTNGAPRAYSHGAEPTEFEKRIWNDFWTIANDEDKAKEMGIRAAHGEAVSIKVLSGRAYKVILRASDGLSIRPDDSAPKTRPSA